MEENNHSKLRKNLLGIYLSRYQAEAFRPFAEERKSIDLFRPFKFAGFVFTGLWKLFFSKEKKDS